MTGISAANAGLIGVLGGTFDPIHCGHLAVAGALMETLPLSQVVFVPAARPPHREPPVAAADHRLQMVRIATAGDRRFVVDETEYTRSGPSYTVDTVRGLRGVYRQPLALILGMDAFLGLPGWHRWRALLGLVHFIIIGRPGWDQPLPSWVLPRLVQSPRELVAGGQGRAFLHRGIMRPESATVLRQTLATGAPPPGWLPAGIPAYISDHALYRRTNGK
ncbi:MAG: nicotinate-nucleotide adenylyltransferase [Acidiferrobacter sp.]